MKSLVLLILVTTTANAFVFLNVHNRCDWDLDVSCFSIASHFSFQLVETDHAGKQDVVTTIPGKTSYCILNYQGRMAYQNGPNGKLRASFKFGYLLTAYAIDATHGYDFPLKLVPLYYGQPNGTVLDCHEKGCADAIHDGNEAASKVSAPFLFFYSKLGTVNVFRPASWRHIGLSNGLIATFCSLVEPYCIVNSVPFKADENK